MARRTTTVTTPAYTTYNASPPPSGDEVGALRNWMAAELQRVEQAIPRSTTTAVDAAYTALPTDNIILADATDAAFTVTLPDPTRVKFMRVTIKRTNSGTNLVTVGGTVDGQVNPVLAEQYDSMAFVSNGTEWINDGVSLASLVALDSARQPLGTEQDTYSSEFIEAPTGWGWLNQGTSTVSYSHSRILMAPQAGGAGTNALRLYGPTTFPSAPWACRARMINYMATTGDGGGLFAYRASNSRIHTAQIYRRTTAGTGVHFGSTWAVNDWSNYSTINATRYGGVTQDDEKHDLFLQLRCDGTSLYFDVSPDNERYTNVSSNTLAVYLGGTGTDLRAGIIANCPNATATGTVGYDFFRVYSNANLNQ